MSLLTPRFVDSKGILYFEKREDIEFPNFEDLVKDGIFSVKSHNCNLTFSVGDHVVISDWNDTSRMLKIWTITGFTTKNDEIRVQLQDDSGEETSHLLVFGRESYIDSIRKVVNSDLVNCKIRALHAGISCFPKKNAYKVIAVLEDPKEPLVLCSNGCTLFLSQVISMFRIVRPDDPKWSRIRTVDDVPQKFPLQENDIVVSEDGLRAVIYRKIGRSSRFGYARLDFYGTNAVMGFCNPTPDSILYPRIQTKYREFISGYYDLFGNVIPDDNARFKFLDIEVSGNV